MSWIRLQNRRALRLAPAVLAIGAFVIVSCSRSSVCVQETKEYQERLDDVRGQLGFPRLIGRGTGPTTEGTKFVGGQSDPEPIEGSPSDVFLRPDYSINCMLPPYRVDGAIGQQTITNERPNPWFCHSLVPQQKYPSLEPKARKESGAEDSRFYLESVGALMITPTYGSYKEEFWGSGFMIGDNLFATSCHNLEPLLEKGDDGRFHVPDPNPYTWYVDFSPGYGKKGDPTEPDLSKQFIANYKDCSDEPGLDVAILTLKKSQTGSQPPPKVPLYLDDLSFLQKHVNALVGYVDLRHPMDKITSEMYDYFVPTYGSDDDYGYWKFAMLNKVSEIKHCNDNLDLLLDSADTSVGSSGSLVLDPFLQVDPHGTQTPVAIGLHKCCAAYFGEEKSTGPQPEMPCARMVRTQFNQDVSTTSILKDPNLCRRLIGYVNTVDHNGNSVALKCQQE